MDNLPAISIGIWPSLLLFGVLQGILIAAGLLMQKNRRKLPNSLLALLLFVFSLHLSEYVNISTGYYQRFPNLIGISVPLIFLVGPVYYLYNVSLYRPAFRIEFRQLFHFMPALLCYLVMIKFYLLSPQEKTAMVSQILNNGYVIFPLGQFLILSLSSMQMILYYYITYKFAGQMVPGITGKFTGQETPSGSWFKKISFGFAIYMVLFFVAYFQLFFLKIQNQDVFYIVMLVLSFYVHAIGFNAIRNPDIFTFATSKNEKPKYKNTALSERDLKGYVHQLLKYMESSKPFLNAELKLGDIAMAMEIEPYQLSQVINSEFNKNFFDFVNEYRIEEAKSRILDPKFQHFTLLEIALDVGFNNKSSFNRVFKKHTSTTPSDFMKTNHVNQTTE